MDKIGLIRNDQISTNHGIFNSYYFSRLSNTISNSIHKKPHSELKYHVRKIQNDIIGIEILIMVINHNKFKNEGMEYLL